MNNSIKIKQLLAISFILIILFGCSSVTPLPDDFNFDQETFVIIKYDEIRTDNGKLVDIYVVEQPIYDMQHLINNIKFLCDFYPHTVKRHDFIVLSDRWFYKEEPYLSLLKKETSTHHVTRNNPLNKFVIAKWNQKSRILTYKNNLIQRPEQVKLGVHCL